MPVWQRLANTALPAAVPPPLPSQITDKDAEVLSYLTDVRCERFHGTENGGEDADDEVSGCWARLLGAAWGASVT